MMPNQNKSIVAAIKHFISSHPEIAPEIEKYAAKAQGKSDEDFLNFAEWKQYQNLSTQQIFERIYAEGHWGKNQSQNDRFFSGTGSHDPRIVHTYVDAVTEFVNTLSGPLSALDIGCGDFNVGSKLRGLFSTYKAVDIANNIIDYNRTKFVDLDVDFNVLDLVKEAPPYADVIFLRQVLQHLSNAQIMKALENLEGRFAHLILTEHIPPGEFKPNIDKTTGRGIRIRHYSGVDIGQPPFNFRSGGQKILSEVSELGGIIRTTAYSR
jgi:hypothetical protein